MKDEKKKEILFLNNLLFIEHYDSTSMKKYKAINSHNILKQLETNVLFQT